MSMFCHPCVVVFTWATWAIFHTKNGYVFSLVYTKTAEESDDGIELFCRMTIPNYYGGFEWGEEIQEDFCVITHTLHRELLLPYNPHDTDAFTLM